MLKRTWICGTDLEEYHITIRRHRLVGPEMKNDTDIGKESLIRGLRGGATLYTLSTINKLTLYTLCTFYRLCELYTSFTQGKRENSPWQKGKLATAKGKM